MSDILPHEIWVDILHRLTVKSLGKCACVCKAWKSVITDNAFICNHYNFQANNGNGSLLLRFSRPRMESRLGNFNEFYSLHLDNEQFDLLSTFKYPYIDGFRNECSRVVGTCNGLVCLAADLEAFIWNPSIQKYVILPKPRVTFRRIGYNEGCVGFGFDSRTKDFKVVRFVTLFSDRRLPKVEVYSLATGSWRSITSRPPPCLLCSNPDETMQPQIFMNGVIHWVLTRRSNDQTYNFILLFDVDEETFGELMLPQQLKESPMQHVSILAGGEKLAVFLINDSDPDRESVSIWVMEEYGVVESWKKVFQSDLRLYGGIKGLLAIRNSGNLVLEVSRGTIVLLDRMRDIVKDLGIREVFCPFVGYHVESLFLLNKENDVVSY